MIFEALPDIPRWYTGLAEWAGAVVYIFLMRHRFGGWKRVALIAGALPVFIGVQVFAGTLDITFWVFGMAGAIFSIFAFLYFMTDSTLKDAGYLTARAFVLAELVASLQWQIWVSWMPHKPTLELGSSAFFGSIGLLIGCYGLGFGLAYLAERKNFPQTSWLGVDRSSLVMAAAIGVGTFLVSNLSFVTQSSPFTGSNDTDIFYIRTLVDLAGFVALYTQQTHRSQMRNAMELAETRVIMKSQHDQFLQSKRNIEELNRMHHDLKYYIDAIREEESADRRADYLHQLEDSLSGYESEIRTGNQMLDVILSSKMERCLQEGITMTNVVDGKALEFMDLMGLSALFGNAIDNAIEACLKISDKDKRHIKVSVFTKQDFVMIRFENYWPRPVDFVEGLPQTTKSNRKRHGYGTQNMRAIVHSYKGSLTIGVEQDWFTVRILIPRGNQTISF